MNIELVKAALEFLKRVDLKGSEAEAMVEVKRALIEAGRQGAQEPADDTSNT